MLKKSRWRRRTMAVVAVLALAPVVPGILLAEAHSFTATSGVTMKWNHNKHNFHGVVSSPRPVCKAERTVNIFKAVPGVDRLIGSVTTYDLGGWSFHRANPNGAFYARVTPMSGGGYGHSHVCLQSRSETLHI